MDIKERIERIVYAKERWLSDPSLGLPEAAERTVEQGFSQSDVKFALSQFREQLTKEALEIWTKDITPSVNPKSILCLHAGNIPFVGLQDMIAVVLSGHHYIGKVSRKESYLLPSFIEVLKKEGFELTYAATLENLPQKKYDGVLFSGSSSSVSIVKEHLNNYELVGKHTKFLIRTAHFSLAYIEHRPATSVYRQLAESMLRYQGNGCRSVHMVISTFSLQEVSCELTDAFEEFWMYNGGVKTPSPQLVQQAAYNASVGTFQLPIEHFLLEDHSPLEPYNHHVFWLKGDQQTVVEWEKILGDELQSIYVNDPKQTKMETIRAVEPLNQAQRPFIFWKPDGVDALFWLSKIGVSE